MKKIKATRSFFKKALPRQQRKKYPLKTLTTSEFLNCLFSVKAIDSSIQLSIWFYKICFLRMVVLILRWPNFKLVAETSKNNCTLLDLSLVYAGVKFQYTCFFIIILTLIRNTQFMSCKERGLKSSLSVCPLNNIQSFTRYFRLTLAFCQIVYYRKSLISVLFCKSFCQY